ncbi:MAG TPA: hypothetical protein VHA56_18545 [Mucilaginibacter sp.]|nr:hypothetical protein [Mucilaginibacter sp.]
MSSSKTFIFNLFCNGNIEILQCNAEIMVIRTEKPLKVFSGSFDVQDGAKELTFSVNDGDHLYAVFNIWKYKYQGIVYDISPNNKSGQRKVGFLAIFNAAENTIAINPLSTVASAYTFVRGARITDGVVEISANKDFCEVAYAMKNNFYYTGGGISKVISSSPNDKQTNSYASFNFLANLISYSLTDLSVYTSFLNCINSISGVTASSVLGSLVAVAQHPFDQVQEIYGLIDNLPPVYQPSLTQLTLPEGVSTVPDQWTLAVKVNDSGSKNFLISGTAFTVFDKENKAWVTNNFRAGTDKSGTHCLVFNPDGSPADISPIMGGGILGPGFGVGVSPDGETIAIGNYGWGVPDWNPAEGSVSMFKYTGGVVSPPNGYTEGLTRVQGVVYDQQGNLWMASWGTQESMADPSSGSVYHQQANPSAVVCYLGGDHNQMLSFNNFFGNPSQYHGTFAVAIDKDGSAIVSNAGTAGKMASSVHRVRIADDRKSLICVASWLSDWQSPNPDQIPNFEEFRQPQTDSEGNVYVGGITSGRVVKLSPELEKLDAFSHDIHGPWGLTFDTNDKKFICGFGEKEAIDASGSGVERAGTFGISVVESSDVNWENVHLMTLPTGGDPVRLANGQPLYGFNQLDKNDQLIPESYQPLMRVTATSIDRAGNLWCANNWKPSLYIDAKSPDANPGGDGVVIFIGVAEPLAGINP